MIPFVDALMKAQCALADAGYPGARLSVLLSAADVLPVQRELEMATRMLEQALRPEPAPLFGVRLLAVVHGIHVYVRED